MNKRVHSLRIQSGVEVFEGDGERRYRSVVKITTDMRGEQEYVGEWTPDEATALERSRKLSAELRAVAAEIRAKRPKA
jgi:hypothetical protein